MRLLSLIIISTFLFSNTLQAQQWGTKQDTIYHNSFDKEATGDTLYNHSSLVAKQHISNEMLVLYNSIMSKEKLEITLVNNTEATEMVSLTFNHKNSVGVYLDMGNYRFGFEEKGVRIRVLNNKPVKPAITYFGYDSSKDTTTLLFNASYKSILTFQIDDKLSALPWNSELITQKLFLPPGKSFYIKSLFLGESATKKAIAYNFTKESQRWSTKDITSKSIAGFTKYVDGKYIISTSTKSRYSGYRGTLYSTYVKQNEKTEILLSGPFNDKSTVDFLIGGKKFEIRNNRIGYNSNYQYYVVPDDKLGAIMKISIYQNRVTVSLGGFLKSFNWKSENFDIKYQIPSNAIVSFDKIIHLKKVSQTFEGFVSAKADKEVAAWKIKGSYEKTLDYENRISSKNLSLKKSQFVQELVNEYGAKKLSCTNVENSYNPDTELFRLDWKGLNTVYLSMPPLKAKVINGNFCDYKFTNPQFTFENDAFYLTSATLMVNNVPYYISNTPSNLLASNRSGNVSTSTYVKKTVSSALKDKNYYLLVIANQDYPDSQINSLNNPIQEGEALILTLTSLYNFRSENVSFLTNANRAQIIGEFDKLSRIIKPEDNLLIYYAGHGIWDEKLKTGYWLPVDASKDKRANWFSNSNLRDYIAGINTKHTLLISDACFSGSIFKTRNAFTSSRGMAELYSLNSRQAITSGSLNEAVPDKSVFSQYLIKRLTDNPNEMMSALQLFNSFRIAVINNSPNAQTPQFGDIRETGDEGGEFIFIKK